MSSVDVLRSAAQTLCGNNGTLGLSSNDSTMRWTQPSFGGSSAYMNSPSGNTPLDLPLHVNTTMTAKERVNLYRRLGHPPSDSEPTLLIRF